MQYTLLLETSVISTDGKGAGTLEETLARVQSGGMQGPRSQPVNSKLGSPHIPGPIASLNHRD